jgi:superfamily II DNA or RNA helicase
VGSSNLSRSALIDGVEWNYRLQSSQEPSDYEQFVENFDRLFASSLPLTDEWLKEYSLAWKRPRWIRAQNADPEELDEVYPQGSQIEALHYLEESRAEGFRRGMVVMATGVGKRIWPPLIVRSIAVYFLWLIGKRSSDKPGTPLAKWFPLRPWVTSMPQKRPQMTEIVFASVQTLSQERYLTPTYFHTRVLRLHRCG